MSLITTKRVAIDAGNITMGAAASGDTAQCGDGYMLLVQNGDASPHDVTIAVPGTLETGDAYPDKTYTIPAGEMWPIPLYDFYADPSDGLAHLTWSATTSMTRAVLKN